MKIDLHDRVAVVTGASGYLGRVMVRTLAACGADVVIHYQNNVEMAEQLRKEVLEMGVRTMVCQADITQLDSIMAMRNSINNELGAPDIIVNNAVIQYEWKRILDQDEKDYDSQFRSCVLQSVFMAKAFVPAMVQKKYGRVIAINTECAMQNGTGQSAYVAGKRGLDGIVRILAREVGEHQITVNQVAPGFTISDRDRATGTESKPAYEKSVALKRRGTDQEIANAVAFLASDLASFITGAFIPVCGGNVMPTI
ncbi:MAG: SDR family oxidoreductase [Planctomycetota bacterium]|nr:SDR family oxidoreductase [Planctomycetota bacterium]